MSTTTANFNDSRLFTSGPTATNAAYANVGMGWIMAFDFVGTQVEAALNGYFTVSVDGGSPVAVTPSQGNGLANILTTGLADTSHSIVIVSTASLSGGASQILASGAVIRVTGGSPAISSSSVYANHVSCKLGTGPAFGNQIADLTHVRVDGGLCQGWGGQASAYVGSAQNSLGGSITLYTSASAIKIFCAQNYTVPGGFYVKIDGGTPTYIDSNHNFTGSQLPDGIYPLLSGLDTASVHKYELRAGFGVGFSLTDIVLVGGSGLDTTHSLPARKKIVCYGDSIVQDFVSGSNPPDQVYDTNPGDRGFGALLAAYNLDMALFCNSHPSQPLSSLVNIGSIIGNAFGSQSNFTNADYVFLEPGINNLSDSTEQTNFASNYATLISNSLALFTNASVKIYCQNLYHNTSDDSGTGTAYTNLQARRTAIANAVTSASNAKVLLADVSGWIATANTIDGTHPSGSGNALIASHMTSLLSPGATSYTFTGPSTCTVGVPVTLTITPNAPFTGTITISSTGAATSPTSLSWTSDSSAKTVTYTATGTGPQVLTPSSSGALTDPAALTITASSGTTFMPSFPSASDATVSAGATVVLQGPMCADGGAYLYVLAASDQAFELYVEISSDGSTFSKAKKVASVSGPDATLSQCAELSQYLPNFYRLSVKNTSGSSATVRADVRHFHISAR